MLMAFSVCPFPTANDFSVLFQFKMDFSKPDAVSSAFCHRMRVVWRRKCFVASIILSPTWLGSGSMVQDKMMMRKWSKSSCGRSKDCYSISYSCFFLNAFWSFSQPPSHDLVDGRWRDCYYIATLQQAQRSDYKKKNLRVMSEGKHILEAVGRKTWFKMQCF